MTKYDLDPLRGGGAHMWRGGGTRLFHESIRIFSVSPVSLGLMCQIVNIFSYAESEEPVYGKPPKPDRYAEVRGKSRYFL